MSDIFLRITDKAVTGLDIPICVRKDSIIAVERSRATGFAIVYLNGMESREFYTSVPYEEFIRQFMVMEVK